MTETSAPYQTTPAAFDLPSALAAQLADPKPWWQSETIRGLLFAVVTKLAGAVTLTLVAYGAPPSIAEPLVYVLILAGASLLGDLAAWVGRIRGTGGPIDMTRILPGLTRAK